MDWLYRIFYTVLSLTILMILLFPVAAGIRFLLRNVDKKYTIWEWRLLFFRSICPVALSSALCIFPMLNRKYHRFLSDLGLVIHDGQGIMRSWLSVFKSDITVSAEFKICSIIWLIGVVGVLVCAFVSYFRLRRELKGAKMIGENIYESPILPEPVMLGIFREKLYLPQGFQTQETAWLLRHMEQHHREGMKHVILTVILACHWLNPVMWLYYYWWNMDMEMAADDRTVYRKKEAERKAYAQGILNFVKEQKGGSKRKLDSLFLFGIAEKNTQKRAYRMMYRKWNNANARLFSLLLFSLTFIFCFLLSPMQTAWSGGTWGNGENEKEKEELFVHEDASVVTKMGTKSPEGLDRMIQLEMVKGAEDEKGYDGTFVIKMYDNLSNEIDSCEIEDIFPEIQKGSQHFSKNVTLCISDYNGDNVQELVIGQQIEVGGALEAEPQQTALPTSTPEQTTTVGQDLDNQTYSYALINIENEKLEILCKDIVATGKKGEMGESIPFNKLEDINNIFMVPSGENTFYYIWNDSEKTYEKRIMTEKDLEAYRQNANPNSDSQETEEHTLENKNGDVAVLVSTKRDSTQSEEIQSVTLFPRKNSKKFKDIQGYYCDLLWIASGDEENRYANLIYNGTKSQTFVIYDTKRKNVYYQHEDGAERLAAVFKQFREDEITFNEGGAVIYEMAEKNEDVITINFAASADNGVTVKGSYDYNVVKRTASNLTFARAEE